MQIQYEYCSFLETIIVVILIVLKYNHLFGPDLVPAIFQGYITWIKAQWPAHIRYCMQRNPSISCIHPDSSSDLSTSQYCKRPQRLWPLHHAHTQSVKPCVIEGRGRQNWLPFGGGGDACANKRVAAICSVSRVGPAGVCVVMTRKRAGQGGHRWATGSKEIQSGTSCNV